jgi:hypothetical protein
MFNKICTMMAKSAPYPPCTVTAFWLKYQDRDRMLRRVTQPPHIAGPLVVMGCAIFCYQICNHLYTCNFPKTSPG